MSSWRAFCEAVHVLTLSLWLGVVVCTGAAAAVTFPTVKAMRPTLPEFAGYSGDHWPIAGGKIVTQLFLMADIVQFVCSLLAVGTLACLVFIWSLPKARPATLVRALALGVALASFGSMLLVLTPAMNASLRAFWDAAAAGNNDAAAVHKAAFDSNHPLASKLLGLTAVAVLVALVSAVWALVRPATVGTPAPADRGSRYEVPRLAKGGV